MRSDRFWSFQKPGSEVWDSLVSIFERMVAASKTPPDLKYFFFELRYRRSQFFKHGGLPLDVLRFAGYLDRYFICWRPYDDPLPAILFENRNSQPSIDRILIDADRIVIIRYLVYIALERGYLLVGGAYALEAGTLNLLEAILRK